MVKKKLRYILIPEGVKTPTCTCLIVCGHLALRSKISSMLHTKTLTDRGPRGEPIATPSVCPNWPLNVES